jgi:hypothetical protein
MPKAAPPRQEFHIKLQSLTSRAAIASRAAASAKIEAISSSVSQLTTGV